MHVYQLIAENTVESKVVDIQERKKKLISEVCSPVYRRHVCPELMCSVFLWTGFLRYKECYDAKAEAGGSYTRFALFCNFSSQVASDDGCAGLAYVDLIEIFGLRQQAANKSRSQTTLDRFAASS